METETFAARKSIIIISISGIFILFGLYLTTLYNYLLFHSIAEIFIIVVACGIFILAWNSRKFLENNYLLFIGIAYLFIAILELIHTLSYSGMGIFKGYDANLPTQFWIAARYMESLSLLIAPLFISRRIRLNILFITYASATCLIFLSIFLWNIFPVCFVEGIGLTPFKKISEYIICLIFLGAIALLYQKRKEFEVGVSRLLIASILLAIAAELAFTFYIHAYGFSNLIGHYFKIISFYLIYKAIIETGLVRPYNLLFRNLKRSEELLNSTQHLTKVGGWEWDIEKQTMFWTNEVYRLHDFQPREFQQDSTEHIERSLECYDIEDRPVIIAAFKECAEKGQAYDLEFPFTTAMGRRIWIRTVAEPGLDGDRVIKVVGNIMDITERKQAFESFKEQKEFSEKIIETSSAIIVGLDKNHRIKIFNKGAEKITGFKSKEVIDSDWFKIFFEPELYDEMDKVWKDAWGTKFHSYVNPIRAKNGAKKIISWQTTGVYEGADERKHILISIGEDITELKHVEEALRESEEKYRLMMESMKDQSYICSPELRIEYMNPAMIDRVGRDTLGGLCHRAIYDRDEKCSWCVFDQVQQGEHIDYEVADPKNNRYYSVTNSPISHNDGTVSKLTIFHDITKIKNIEAQLQQSRKMESIGTLTGGIAHDFNNILYMITGNAELALEDIPEWNPAHANLEEIKAAGLRAAGIVKQLLSFSRKTDQELKPIGVITVIKDALKFLHSTIPTTIEIRKHLPDTDVAILADPVQINQVMMNLCINASQAMEETGGILKITVENVTLDEEVVDSYPDLTRGDHVKLTVSDTGPGIDPEIIDRIFDPYFTTKEVGKGSGMGLAVVLGIVKNHDGAITVDSEPGKGTTFNILFPVIAEKPEVETETTDELPLGTETILFIDDEESIANMTQKMLERLGYKVETKLNPVEAIELFKSKPDHFGLVITDMTMPQMTGVKLSEKLKEIRSDIPVIICTGHSSLIDEEKAIEMGIAAYVMKPIVKKEIAKTIRKVLDKAKSSSQGQE